LDNEWYEKIGDRADEEWFDEWPAREERLRMLEKLFLQATEYIVIDDADLSHVEGWTHYFAWDFVKAVESDTIETEFPR